MLYGDNKLNIVGTNTHTPTKRMAADLFSLNFSGVEFTGNKKQSPVKSSVNFPVSSIASPSSNFNSSVQERIVRYKNMQTSQTFLILSNNVN